MHVSIASRDRLCVPSPRVPRGWQASWPETAEQRYEEWLSSLQGCSELVRKAFIKELVKTIENWREEVFAYFDNRYTNGFTERMNQEVKRI